MYSAANEANPDPYVTAILKAKVNELLPRQALVLHGTADAIEMPVANVANSFRPLAEKIDAFRKNPSKDVSTQECMQIKSAIATMKTAVAKMRKEGIEVEGGKMIVAKDVLKALENEIAKTEELFDSARSSVVRKVLKNSLNAATLVMHEGGYYERECAYGSVSRTRLLKVREEAFSAMKVLITNALDTNLNIATLTPLKNRLMQKAAELREAARNMTPARQNGKAFNRMASRCLGFMSVALDLWQTISIMSKDDWNLTGSEALAMFEGKLSVSALVEARVHGIDDGDIDPANDDTNIAESHELGSGAAGTVFELQRRDGTSVIFKGETESRTGLAVLSAGKGNNYDDSQRTINLNIASKKGAEALGIGDMIVKYSVGARDGVFGYYMEKAKGVTGYDLANRTERFSNDTWMSADDICQLPDDKRKKVKGDIMRELNRLQWLDLLNGQVDRHHNNYFVHVDRETLKVTVTGIDNDACHSQYRNGAVKFTIDTPRIDSFKNNLKDLAAHIDKENAQAIFDHMMADPGIVTGEDGKLTIDVTEVKNKGIIYALRFTMGAQTLAIPDKIDKAIYDRLMALKEGKQRGDYLGSIKPRLSEASYNAAVSRLDDVIAFAEKLYKAHKVVEDGDWQTVNEEPVNEGEVAIELPDGTKKNVGGKVASNINAAICPSIFARDHMDAIFVPPIPAAQQ